MLSRALAESLRDAGLRWAPEKGDRFVVPDRDLDDEVFVVSDMVVEAVDVPDGDRLLAFNGTTEWALDSVALADAVWLPREDQLRELLRATFRSLTRLDDTFAVEVEVGGERRRFEHPEVAEAYGLALLELIGRSR